MKKLISTIAILLFAVNVFGQGGFFRPVDKAMFEMDITDRDITSDYVPSKWLVRPIVTISALQYMLSKPVTVQGFSSVGTGISYSHFILANGEPYQNFSINALVLFANSTTSMEPVKLSFAGTVTLWEYMNFGAGYSLEHKKFFILTAISYNFN